MCRSAGLCDREGDTQEEEVGVGCFFLLQLAFDLISFYLFLDRREGREKERERNINVWLHLLRPPTWGLASNPGMFPVWESNR